MLTNWYYAVIDPPTEFEDLFKSHFWDHHKLRLNVGDIIRCRASGGEYDLQLSVTHKLDNGEVVCELFPKLPSRFAAGALNELAATGRVKATSKPTLVPLPEVDGLPVVRVEYLEATKWRVRGISGDEISRDHKSEADALKYLQRYLDQMNLTLPSEDAIDAKKAEIKAKRDGTWIESEPEAKVAGKKR